MPQHVFHGVLYWLTDFWCILPCRVYRYAKLDTAHSNIDSKQPLTNGCLGVCSCEIIPGTWEARYRCKHDLNILFGLNANNIFEYKNSLRYFGGKIRRASETRNQGSRACNMTFWYMFAFCCWRHASKSPGLPTKKPIEAKPIADFLYEWNDWPSLNCSIYWHQRIKESKAIWDEMRWDELRSDVWHFLLQPEPYHDMHLRSSLRRRLG